jgi:hypothetical protein
MTPLQEIVKIWIDLSDEERSDFLEITNLNPSGVVSFQRALREKLRRSELFNALKKRHVRGSTPLGGPYTKTYGRLVKSGQLDQGGDAKWEISYPSLKAYVMGLKRKT